MELLHITKEFFKAMEDCDTLWLMENLADEFSFNGHYPPFTKDAFVKGQHGIISAFTNWKYALYDLAVKENTVSGYCSISGIHSGDLQLPSKEVPPFTATLKNIQTEKQKFTLQFQGDKVLTLWTEMGKGMGMQRVLEQLGIVLDRFKHEL